MIPLAIDLFCGLGGWTEGLLAEGYRVIGFDIERHQYGDAKYPAQLVIQDVLTLHGRQFKGAALIVASPPCQEFSYMAMPWSRAKAIAAEYRSGKRDVKKLTALFDACFRIQREAIAAAGHFIPMVVENVRGAQPWAGRARWNFGSYYLWGDVPALMPITMPRRKSKLGSWDTTRNNYTPDKTWDDGRKGRSNFHFHEQTGLPSPSFHGAAHEASVQRYEGYKTIGMNWSNRDLKGQDFTRIAGQQAEGRKNSGGSWFNIGSPGQKETNRNPVHEAVKMASEAGRRTDIGKGARFTSRDCGDEGVKQRGSGAAWFDNGICKSGSKSNARKAASAAIAKIPITLSRYIAKIYFPISKPKGENEH